MSPRKKALFLTLLGAHAVMVVAGVFQFIPLKDQAFGWGWLITSLVTGSQTNFSFFAPGVGSQLKVTFRVSLPEGTSEEVLAVGSREANLRVGNMIDTFWGRNADEEVKRSVAASWAAKVFGDHPRAESVEVFVDAFELPSMREYQAGILPKWDRFYSATFRKANAGTTVRL